MLTSLGRLWRGELPLAKAFWAWGVLGYMIVCAATALMFFALLAAMWAALRIHEVAAWAVAVSLAAATYIEPFIRLGYAVIAAVGVWRSAGAYEGPWYWSPLARAGALVGLAVIGLYALALLWGMLIMMSMRAGI